MPYSRFIQMGLPLNDEESFALLRKIAPVSIIIMGHEFKQLDELQSMIKRINNLYKKEIGIREPLIAIDQEGGNVARLRQIDYSPGNYALGYFNDPKITRYFGRRTGYELRRLGFHWDLAPVLDVLGNYENYIVMERSFSHDPHIVSVHGSEFIKGLQEYGISATAKHFPGHGQVIKDSHVELPVDNREFDSVKNTLYPFKRAIEEGVKSIMMSHVLVKALDSELPVSLSSKWYAFLRKEMGYDGLIVTDSLDMKAISKNFSPFEIARNAYNAGADILECVDPLLASEISENMTKFENKDSDRLRRIDALYMEPSIYVEPPTEISTSFSFNSPIWKRRVIFDQNMPVAIKNFLTAKHSEDFVDKLISRLNLMHIKAEKYHEGFAGDQVIFIAKNMHLNGKFREINSICNSKRCVVVGTGIPIDYPTLNEGIGYIASMGEKYENILSSVFKIFNLF